MRVLFNQVERLKEKWHYHDHSSEPNSGWSSSPEGLVGYNVTANYPPLKEPLSIFPHTADLRIMICDFLIGKYRRPVYAILGDVDIFKLGTNAEKGLVADKSLFSLRQAPSPNPISVISFFTTHFESSQRQLQFNGRTNLPRFIFNPSRPRLHSSS
jgi:hypothetical protein